MLLCCTSVVALSPAAAQDTAPTHALEAEVEARERAFAQSMADRDIERFAAFIDSEAVFFSGATALRGRDAIVSAWRPYFENAQAPFSWEPDQVEGLASGHLTLTSGPVHDPGGVLIGRFNSVWRRAEDGIWRVVFDKGCAVCPASAPTAPACSTPAPVAQTPD
ncbi:nuclear transport factor 2 family protein [Sinimarinibacterium sp. CAU 1509]|nr:nuclear transport factor 2 family protein [Sinimarinibacterium sp. CAU 1509]